VANGAQRSQLSPRRQETHAGALEFEAPNTSRLGIEIPSGHRVVSPGQAVDGPITTSLGAFPVAVE